MYINHIRRKDLWLVRHLKRYTFQVFVCSMRKRNGSSIWKIFLFPSEKCVTTYEIVRTRVLTRCAYA